MLRILHCYKSYMPDEVGGVAEAIAMVTSAHDPELDHSILVGRPRGRAKDFQYDGIPVHAVASIGTIASLPVAPGFPFALARRAPSVDLIVHHSPFPLTDVGLVLASSKPAVIVHWHADLDLSSVTSLLVKPLLRMSLRRADRIVVPHESVMDGSPYLKGFAEKCVVIPYGVDFEYWANLNADEKDKVAEIRRKFSRLIVATGRLVPYKGHSVLLRAMQKVDATLCIIGTGALRGQLDADVRDMQLDRNVMLMGWQDRSELKLMLHAARVFAFPSLTSAESFGIAQLEAMAARLPVVNTALLTAVPFVARHEREGLTVPPGDADAFASALRRLLDNTELAEQFGQAAQDRVKSNFDRKGVLAQTRQLYEETTAQHTRGRRSGFIS